MAYDPIAYEDDLGCTTEQAFTVYAERIGEWWDPRYTANPETFETVTIEPRVGGRVYANHSDVGRDEWGEVTVWEPGRRLVHTFALAQDPKHPSEIDVWFEARDEGCTVRFVHGGWTSANVEARGKFDEWRVMLDRFVALASGNFPPARASNPV